MTQNLIKYHHLNHRDNATAPRVPPRLTRLFNWATTVKITFLYTDVLTRVIHFPGQVDVRPAVGRQALALNALLHPGLLLKSVGLLDIG